MGRSASPFAHSQCCYTWRREEGPSPAPGIRAAGPFWGEFSFLRSGRKKRQTFASNTAPRTRTPPVLVGVLGHHMGTDARGLFLEAHYFLLPSSYLEANVDFTQRDFPGPEREETWRVSGAIVAWLTKNLRAEGRLAFESVSNENGVAGKDETDAVLQAALSYQYR